MKDICNCAVWLNTAKLQITFFLTRIFPNVLIQNSQIFSLGIRKYVYIYSYFANTYSLPETPKRGILFWGSPGICTMYHVYTIHLPCVHNVCTMYAASMPQKHSQMRKWLLKIDFQSSKESRVSFWVSCLGGGSLTYVAMIYLTVFVQLVSLLDLLEMVGWQVCSFQPLNIWGVDSLPSCHYKHSQMLAFIGAKTSYKLNMKLRHYIYECQVC